MSGHSPTHGGGKGYETTDAKPPVLLRWGGGVLITVGFAFGLMWLCFHALGIVRDKLDGSKPTQMQLQSMIPNAPLLQVDQTMDLKVQRAKDQKAMHGYSHNPKTGAWTIPVDSAIKILAQRGLPEPKGPAPEGAAKK
jgi:hypothetical protein